MANYQGKKGEEVKWMNKKKAWVYQKKYDRFVDRSVVASAPIVAGAGGWLLGSVVAGPAGAQAFAVGGATAAAIGVIQARFESARKGKKVH